VVTEPAERARRFTCPYHAWTYDETGALVGISARGDFGEIDPACHGLVRLPVAERAGLVFVVPRPGAALDADAFLGGWARLLEQFGFEGWRLVARRSVARPGWKIAYDGYLDLYHLPFLHKGSFGPGASSRALYDAVGPYQRASFPDPGLVRLEALPEARWETWDLLRGVWTISPHVSIATFDVGRGAVLVSQLFPGDGPLASTTVQSLLMTHEPGEAERAAAAKLFELLGRVVQDEDYATGLRQQRALLSGARPEVLFGRNEGGGQRFHRFVDRLLALDDRELAAAFAGE
jgi:phenylpropionate dioxygenase-like ring-hydroxylating dioxygenase large terminal subunit